MSINNESAQILKPLEKFVDFSCGKEKNLDNCIVDEPFVSANIFGYLYCKEDIKMFFNTGNAKLKIKIYNHVENKKENVAYQYATIIGLFSDDSSHLAFGGTFVNKLIKEDIGWMLKDIKFNLQFSDDIGKTHLNKNGLIFRSSGYGNKAFIKKWKTIDDRIGHNMSELPNMGERMISPDFDTPWYIIKKSDLELSDEEQIKELVYKFAYSFDLATFHGTSEIFTDDVKFRWYDVEFDNKRDTIGYLKLLKKSTPRSHNSFDIKDIKIDGQKAFLSANKIAPDLRNLRNVSSDFNQWISGAFNISFVKESNKWKINMMIYKEEI